MPIKIKKTHIKVCFLKSRHFGRSVEICSAKNEHRLPAHVKDCLPSIWHSRVPVLRDFASLASQQWIGFLGVTSQSNVEHVRTKEDFEMFCSNVECWQCWWFWWLMEYCKIKSIQNYCNFEIFSPANCPCWGHVFGSENFQKSQPESGIPPKLFFQKSSIFSNIWVA